MESDAGEPDWASDLTSLYENYATTHAGLGHADSVVWAFRRDVAPHLPLDREAQILDLGCGQGGLLTALREAGYRAARGVDISPEQVEIAQARGVDAVLADFREVLRPGGFDVIIATDFLEHFPKLEVMDVLRRVAVALAPGGAFIARVPNAVSPFGGNFRYGDFTHETSFTPRSLRQISRVSGLSDPKIFPCNPIGHGFRSHLRVLVWRFTSMFMRITFAAETGDFHAILTQNIVLVARRP